MVAEPGVRFGIANGLLVGALLLVGGVLHLTGEETEFLIALFAGFARFWPASAAHRGVGVVAWAMCTGFVVNRYGVLTLGHHDLVRLAAFALATGAIAISGHCTHTASRENGTWMTSCYLGLTALFFVIRPHSS